VGVFFSGTVSSLVITINDRYLKFLVDILESEENVPPTTVTLAHYYDEAGLSSNMHIASPCGW